MELKNTTLFTIVLLIAIVLLAANSPIFGKDRIASSAEEVAPLLPGLEVPDVELTTVDGKPYALRSETTDQATIIIFYRGGW
jgi:hypothetical protein